MADVRIIGLDIAKSVFQLHGLDDAGATVLQKRLTRSRMLPFFEKLPPCLIGIEACATSHYWARELSELGHEVKLMPAQYVKPYVKRQKNDMADVFDKPFCSPRNNPQAKANIARIVASGETGGPCSTSSTTRLDLEPASAFLRLAATWKPRQVRFLLLHYGLSR